MISDKTVELAARAAYKVEVGLFPAWDNATNPVRERYRTLAREVLKSALSTEESQNEVLREVLGDKKLVVAHPEHFGDHKKQLNNIQFVMLIEGFALFSSQEAKAHVLPAGWSVQVDVGPDKAVHVTNPAGSWCGLMDKIGPRDALLCEFFRALTEQKT